MRGRPLAPLTLDDADQETLERWVKRPKTAQALAMRARIVLRAAEGAANTQIADEVGITKQTVGKWRKRFVGGGAWTGAWTGCWTSPDLVTCPQEWYHILC